MVFEHIIGQKKIIDILTRTKGYNRVPHALLFHGAAGVGKEALALEFAKVLVCQRDELYCNECSDCQRISQLTHPDVYFIFPASQKITDKEYQDIVKSITANPYMRLNLWANPTISIERIRELKRTAALSTFENKGRVVIIAEAQRMTSEATNSLLKILEEPPDRMTIILTSSQPNLLLPTIISRCQSLRFTPLTWQEIEAALITNHAVDEGEARLIAKLSFGNYRRAQELLEEQLEQKRTLILDLLRTIIRGDLERLLLVEQLVRNDDKKVLKEYLELLLLWFRDAFVFVEGDDRELIVNIDQLETLEKFCSSFETLNFEQIASEIEKAIELIERNVYMNLILINLFYFLKHNLRRKHD